MNDESDTGIADAIGSWADSLPPRLRKALYRWTKILAMLATVMFLVLPELPQFGYTVPHVQQWTAAITFAMSVLTHIADRHTSVPPATDAGPEGSGTASLTPPPGD